MCEILAMRLKPHDPFGDKLYITIVDDLAKQTLERCRKQDRDEPLNLSSITSCLHANAQQTWYLEWFRQDPSIPHESKDA